MLENTVYHLPQLILDPVMALVGAGAAVIAIDAVKFVSTVGSKNPPGGLEESLTGTIKSQF